jgi:hypothetical protein
VSVYLPLFPKRGDLVIVKQVGNSNPVSIVCPFTGLIEGLVSEFELPVGRSSMTLVAQNPYTSTPEITQVTWGVLNNFTLDDLSADRFNHWLAGNFSGSVDTSGGPVALAMSPASTDEDVFEWDGTVFNQITGETVFAMVTMSGWIAEPDTGGEFYNFYLTDSDDNVIENFIFEVGTTPAVGANGRASFSFTKLIGIPAGDGYKVKAAGSAGVIGTVKLELVIVSIIQN